jgi:hypothetical protein
MQPVQRPRVAVFAKMEQHIARVGSEASRSDLNGTTDNDFHNLALAIVWCANEVRAEMVALKVPAPTANLSNQCR